MAWKFVVTDLDGAQVGEVYRASERKVNLPLNGLTQASFKIRLDDPLADEVTSRDGDVLLKVYQGTTIRFVGDLTSAEEVGEAGGATLACNFAGPLWRLQKRLAGKTTSGPPASFSAVDRAQIYNYLVDLNNVGTNFEQDAAGNDLYSGIELGTLDTLDAMDYDGGQFKPIAEIFTEVATLMVLPYQNPGTYTYRDTFTGGTVLNARTADSGETWALAAGPDWGATGTTFIQNAVSASASLGVLSPILTGTIVQCDVGTQARLAGNNIGIGVIARYVDTNNYMHARIVAEDAGHSFQVYKRVAGTDTLIGYRQDFSLTADTFYTVRLHVEANGNWFAYAGLASSSTQPMLLSGFDSVLNTAGALDDGKCGIYRHHTGAASAAWQSYDNFKAMVPTQAMTPAGIDFELAPVEPTTLARGLQIATLNVRSRIGTTRTTTFEFGDGNHAIRSFRRVISREGLLTRAYALPTNALSEQVTISRSNTAVETALAARGLYEEVVPTDVSNAALRQALVDLHVGVRKTARYEVSFDPSQVAPVFGTDYVVGDTVTARVKWNNVTHFEGAVRIYGVEVDIDSEGKETYGLRLAPE